ncbi:MAG: DUF5110 domain-containing protein [Rikenellaceae bacterium]|nr:DUF5110 domain-containing protein [Rikenellaceae bacterium]
MNIRRLLCLLAFTGTLSAAQAQTAFLCDRGIAVFYPEVFDSARLMPSLAIVRDLAPAGKLPAKWALRPEYTEENGKAVIRIAYPEGADLYGTGEVIGDLRRNGTEVSLWNTDNYAYKAHDGKQLYQSHPWILGLRPDGTAFGILIDNTWKQRFTLGNPIEIVSEGPAPRVVIIERQTPQQVMQALADLTGHMELPPLWALGFQQCRYSYFPDSRVREIADEFRTRRLPCDVIWMDIDYMDGFRCFTFDKERFPDPGALNDYLHGKQFKSVYMIDPGLKQDENYFAYRQGMDKDLWVKDKDGNVFIGNVWPGPCAFPDFTRPETRAWWSSLYKDFVATGIDGVWNDMNEPAVFGGVDFSMPEDNRHAGGGDLPADIHRRYHNVYGMLMIQATREGILTAHPDKRPFVLSRANFLGGHRYGATWTGDNASTWDYLRVSIPMSMTLGLSGQPFNGPDIGGFGGNADPELLAHWMAVGAYYPFSRNHSSAGTADQEPWVFGPEVENISRTALERRYRLLPYLYTTFREASQNGMPVMRPVFMADPADPALRQEQEAFLLGGDLLVIPRWSSDPALPKGDWDILKLEDTDDGYQPYVALRPGAIVPMHRAVQNTEQYRADSITLLVNPLPNGKAEGTLYDDAGNGFGYREGDYSLCRFTASRRGGRLRVDVRQTEGDRPSARVYRIGYVTDEGIAYTDWTASTTLYAPFRPDTQEGIDLTKLKMSERNFNGSKSLRNMMTDNPVEVPEGAFF